MSHFTVMVTGEDIDTQLAPFCERTEVCPQHLLEFEDSEEKYLKKYNEGTSPSFYDASSSSWGQVISKRLFESLRGKLDGDVVELTFDKKDMDMMHYWKCHSYYHVGCAQDTHKCPEEYVWVKVTEIVHSTHPAPDVCFEGTIRVEIVAAPLQIPNNKQYATFEIFMQEYAGYSERDNKTNRYGYWYNPQAKWDWCQIGGRWAGFFHIKPEFQHLYSSASPNFSWGWKDNPIAMAKVRSEKRVDIAMKGHIDWEFMMNDAAIRAGKEYDFAMDIIGYLPPNESWEVVRDGGSGDDAREKYWAQPRCKAWKDFSKDHYQEMSDLGISGFSGSPDDYLCSRETFIEQKRRQSICPFALLHNGKWAQKGEMGWWAIVTNENDNWIDVFHKALASMPDDTKLTMVDCHI